MRLKKETIGYILLALTAIASVVGVLFVQPIMQSESYHHFSDANTIFTIPNFWNVISNLPFLVVGLMGLVHLKTIVSHSKVQYLLFFIGVALVSIGSGYYHLHPSNATLVWDRLPMTIAFMALFSIVISEFVDEKIGQQLLIPALLLGLASIVYWIVFNDLRMYILVQFYPIVAILIVLVFFKSKYTLTVGYWILLIAYIVAKFLEYFDYQVLHFLKVISGHTLKHVVAAIGIYILLITYQKRKNLLTTI